MIAATEAVNWTEVLIIGVPSVVGSLVAGGCAVWAAKVSTSNRAKIEEVKRKVTTPGDGTIGEKVEKIGSAQGG